MYINHLYRGLGVDRTRARLPLNRPRCPEVECVCILFYATLSHVNPCDHPCRKDTSRALVLPFTVIATSFFSPFLNLGSHSLFSHFRGVLSKWNAIGCNLFEIDFFHSVQRPSKSVPVIACNSLSLFVAKCILWVRDLVLRAKVSF